MHPANTELTCTTCANLLANGELVEAEGWNESQFNQAISRYYLAFNFPAKSHHGERACFTCGSTTPGPRYEITVDPR